MVCLDRDRFIHDCISAKCGSMDDGLRRTIHGLSARARYNPWIATDYCLFHVQSMDRDNL